MHEYQDIEYILSEAKVGNGITHNDAMRLMRIDIGSPDFDILCHVADQMTRLRSNNLGEVFVQIGLNYEHCSKGCSFCLFGTAEIPRANRVIIDIDDVIEKAVRCEREGANAIYLMTTANYDMRRFLIIGKAVRDAISPDMPLVTNIGDFDIRFAQNLVDAGFNAIYHTIRVREGQDTGIPIRRRLSTIQNAKLVGLAIHFCIEPVGPEHCAQEIVDLMFLGRQLGVAYSGAMSRVNIPGSPLEKFGQLSQQALARVVAVSRLVMGNNSNIHCTHEPNLPALKAGANLLWAEAGPNPRDEEVDTEIGRGMSIRDCQKMLVRAGYESHHGPSSNVWPPECASLNLTNPVTTLER